MKILSFLALGPLISVSLISASALADQHFTAHYYVPHEPYAAQVESLSAAQKQALHEYLEYEEREPCQHYQIPPAPFVKDGCDIVIPQRSVSRSTVTTTETTRTGLRPVVSSYTIYFDFDKSNIRESEQATLRRVASEIKNYEPYEVTLEGHADRSGPNDYNLVLSQKRAKSVSDALNTLGIPHRILTEEAYGENKPAVATPDGVRLEENRRVEIQFRK